MESIDVEYDYAVRVTTVFPRHHFKSWKTQVMESMKLYHNHLSGSINILEWIEYMKIMEVIVFTIRD